MMKSIKVLALITSTIALFPSASFADTLSDNTQSVNQDSTIFGSHNMVRSNSRQSIMNYPANRHDTSVTTNSQRAEIKAIVIDNDNTIEQSIIQKNLNRQRSK